MLLHRRNKYATDDRPRKRVSLYLNQGAQRKFSGMLSLRSKSISRIVTLSRPETGCLQEVAVGSGVKLTVLPAYHDDPAAAIVSEFGAEMKGFHFELVEKMADALHDKRQDEHKSTPFVIPGDVTMVYDITSARFLCHEDLKLHEPTDLCWRKACSYRVVPTSTPGAENTEAMENKERAHLYTSKNANEKLDNEVVKKYYEARHKRQLPHHKS